MSAVDIFKGAALAIPLCTTIPALNAAIILYASIKLADAINDNNRLSAVRNFAVTSSALFGVFATGGIPEFSQEALLSDWLDVNDRPGLVGIANERLDLKL